MKHKINFLPIIIFLYALIYSPLTQSNEIVDVNYQFTSDKLKNVQNEFEFLKTFVDFFYLTLQANQQQLPTLNTLAENMGWCAGDAHPENFGVLLLKNKQAVFTVNDMDDSGPCPVALDLFRLMVSSNLYSADISLTEMIQAYSNGLENKSMKVPKLIQKMMDKSVQKGFDPNKNKIANNRFLRDSSVFEVSAEDKQQIEKVLNSYGPFLVSQPLILDLIVTSKQSGGSTGLLRYEVLVSVYKSLFHLEFKEQTRPAIYPVATKTITVREKIDQMLQLTQGPQASDLYNVIDLNSRPMLIRPKFAGNKNLNLDELSTKDSPEIIIYESYILGKIHSKSIASLKSYIQKLLGIDRSLLADEALLISKYYKKKYKLIK
jgi:hypothetical protein